MGQIMMQMNNNQPKTAVPQQTIQQIQTDVKEALQFVMGDSTPEILDEMSTIFMEDATLLISQIKIGYDSQDFRNVSIAAHTLKGSSATIGLENFADLCLAIEISCNQQEGEQLANHISHLEFEYTQINNALMAFQI